MKHNQILRVAAFCALIAYPQIAFGQDVPLDAEPTPSVLSGGAISESDHIASRGYKTITPSAQISSEDGEFEANFSLDYSFGGEPTTSEVGGVKYIKGAFTNVSLKADVPLGKVDSDSIDFKDFGRDGTAKLSLIHLIPKVASGQSSKPYRRQMAFRCVELAANDWLSQSSGRVSETDSFKQAYRAKLNANELLPWSDALVATASELESNAFSMAATSECAPSSGGIINNDGAIIDYFAVRYPDEDVYRDYVATFAPASATFFGIEGGIGLNTFDIADEPSFTVENSDRLGFDVNAFLGQVLNRGNTSVRLGAGYTRVYEAESDIEFCRPSGTAGESECIEGDNGEPTRKDTGYAEIGLRQVLARRSNGSPSLAIAPTVSYIFEDKDFQVKVPLYFQQSDDGGLDAGIQAIYSGADDDFGVGVFIGVPFGLRDR